MGEVEVIQPGFYTTVQDMGRYGAACYGVPQSGVMDEFSAKKANLILNNDRNAAVLEITMTGPHLMFHGDTQLCITGARFSIKHNEMLIQPYELIDVKKGDEIRFLNLEKGFRAYLAIQGGFINEEIMGSRSQYLAITEASRLRKGDKITFAEIEGLHSRTRSRISKEDSWLFMDRVEAYPGPEYDGLTTGQRDFLINNPFELLATSNRMAINFKHKVKGGVEDIRTSPVLPGTVQLTPAGDMIVLMKDCQVTGGYGRILQVSKEGMSVLAQKRPGESVLFTVAHTMIH